MKDRIIKTLLALTLTAGMTVSAPAMHLEVMAEPNAASAESYASDEVEIIDPMQDPSAYAEAPEEEETISGSEFDDLIVETSEEQETEQDSTQSEVIARDTNESEAVPSSPDVSDNQLDTTSDQSALTITMPEEEGYYLVKANDQQVAIAESGSDLTIPAANEAMPEGQVSLQLLYSEVPVGTYEYYDYTGTVEVTADQVQLSTAPLYSRNNDLFRQLPRDQASLNLLTQSVTLPREYFPPNKGPDYPRIQGNDSKIISTVDQILNAAVLTRQSSADDKAAALYLWVVNNINYDYAYTSGQANRPPDDAVGVLNGKEKKAVCEGFASLLCSFYRNVGIPCLKVDGYAGSNPDRHLSDEPNHAWVAAYLGGDWTLMDPTWDCNERERRSKLVLSISACSYYRKDVDSFSAKKRFDNFDSEVLPSGSRMVIEPSSLMVQAPETASFHASILPVWADQKTSWRVYKPLGGDSYLQVISAKISNGLTVTFKGLYAGSGSFTFTLQNLHGKCPVSISGAPQSQTSSGGSSGSTTTEIAVQDMYRLYNPNSGEHFYTANAGERDYLNRIGWNYEGVGWKAPVTSAHPVYRLYNPNAGDHHYTMNAGERDNLVRLGWNYEGIGWYSDDSEAVPLYRQYNPNARTGSHNYTTSRTENDYLASIGWNTEGIGWYGLAG